MTAKHIVRETRRTAYTGSNRGVAAVATRARERGHKTEPRAREGATTDMTAMYIYVLYTQITVGHWRRAASPINHLDRHPRL